MKQQHTVRFSHENKIYPISKRNSSTEDNEFRTLKNGGTSPSSSSSLKRRKNLNAEEEFEAVKKRSLFHIMTEKNINVISIEAILSAYNIDIDDAVTICVAYIYNDRALSEDKITESVRIIMENYQKCKKEKDPSEVEREYKEEFLTKFYRQIHLEIPSSIKFEGEEGGERCNPSILNYSEEAKGVEDAKSIYKESTALKYLLKATQSTNIQIDTTTSVTCRVCNNSYRKYRSIGFNHVCLECIETFVKYSMEEEIAKIREEITEKMNDFMDSVNDALFPQKKNKKKIK
jgi:hypothetical protein